MRQQRPDDGGHYHARAAVIIAAGSRQRGVASRRAESALGDLIARLVLHAAANARKLRQSAGALQRGLRRAPGAEAALIYALGRRTAVLNVSLLSGVGRSRTN